MEQCKLSLMWKRSIFLFITIFITTAQSYASHIVGGYMRYEHLGDGLYTIELYVYRDCNPLLNPTPLDPNIEFGIFHEINGEFVHVDAVSTRLQSLQKQDLPEDECLEIPEGLCIQLGTYSITYKVKDWPRQTPVIFAYQRCCRNGTISNIDNPAKTGVTYFVELTPKAMQLGNSSPVFHNIPPFVTCVNSELSFLPEVTDTNGNLLVYNICSPIIGGGDGGSPSNPTIGFNSCFGGIPIPVCPPPYNEVLFVSPYSPNLPFPGSSTLSMDNNTGLLKFVPNIQGQFVSAICMEEWENGEKIGEIRMEFQVNVTQCTPTLVLDVEHNKKIEPDEYIIEWCGSLDGVINNLTEIKPFVRDFTWEIDVDDTIRISNDYDLNILFPEYDTYYGKLFFNKGLECTDSINLTINVNGGINADFLSTYDTCMIEPVHFENTSSTYNDSIISYEWWINQELISTDKNLDYLYDSSGLYTMTLIVEDINGCIDTITKDVGFYPLPAEIHLDSFILTGCTPFMVKFDASNPYLSAEHFIEWNFGDKNFSNTIAPTHVYQNEGSYTVSLFIRNIYGCEALVYLENNIEVYPSPNASFTYLPSELNRLNPWINFNNTSDNTYHSHWKFGNIDSSTVTHPTYMFSDTGLFAIELIITNQFGCKDTTLKYVDIVPSITFFMPNGFTPNGPNNNIFIGNGYLDDIKDFNFSIFNRYGQELFYTKDHFTGWNGRLNNTGEMQTSGNYVYMVELIDPRGKPLILRGNFLLIH